MSLYTFPFITGLYAGISNARGINDTPEQVAMYAPVAIASGVTAITLSATKVFGKNIVPQLEGIISNEFIKCRTSEITVKTGLASAAGYGLGYAIGSLNK